MQNVSGHYINPFRFVGANPKPQAAFENVSDLLVVMRMLRNNSAFLDIDVTQHNSVASDQATIERVGHLLFRHVIPTIEADGLLAHWLSPGSKVPTDYKLSLLCAISAFFVSS